ncbi:MAG: B12-binding domain-containing protein, partial [Actinomycetota bacterium]
EQSSRKQAPWSERLEARLVAGDARGAWGVVEAAMAAGRDLDSLYLEVLSPAMVSIGDRWAKGELDVAVEHRASGIAMRVIGRLGHRFVRRGRPRGSVVIGTPPGESHAIPTAIVSDLLRMRGWEVWDLGADVPIESYLFALTDEPGVKAVGLSVTHPANLDALQQTCDAIRSTVPDMKIVLGGGAVCGSDHAESLGADAHAATGADMHDLLDEWYPLSRPAVRDAGLAAGD